MNDRVPALGASWILFLCGVLAASQARAEHHENWIEIKSPHFTVYSNAGEREGRRVAAQFEEIRGMFEQSFPKLRVDSGKPTIVYALKNEDSLKLLIPNYGQNKNAAKLSGFYRPSYDKNYAIVRTDVTGTGSNEFHVMYHEWAHGLFRLNYRGLPLWLDEGLAEYWGGSQIDNKQASVGMPDARRLRLLQQNQLLPIATLVSIDGTSPLYNTQDHSGVFYAESWAIVHYFSMAPEVREQNLLNKYLATLQETDDPIEAANRSFGDLKKLGEKLESYARQPAFLYQKIKLHSEISEKDFAARPVSPAEGLVHQADYLLHSNHLPEAIEALHEAEKLDGNAPGLHDGLGYYHFLKADFENASKEFDQALAASANDALVPLYRALILLRKTGYNQETTPQIVANLGKVIALQPDFAPAHAFLCIAYTQSPDAKVKALGEAKRALELEPGNMAYLLDVGKALVANGRLNEAKQIAERAQKTATWTRDRNMSNAFMKQVNQKLNPASSGSPSTIAAEAVPQEDQTEGAEKQSAAEGQITELICGHPPSAMFTLTTANEQLLFQVKDIGKIEIRDIAGKDSPSAATCAKWKDRQAKITFRLTPDGPAHGEVKSLELE